MRAALILGLGALAGCGAPTAPAPAFPPAMQGRWGLVAADCSGGLEGSTRLEIGPSAIRASGTEQRLTDIASAAPGRVAARMIDAGAPGPGARTEDLEILPPGSTLLLRRQGAEPQRYFLCP